MHTAFCNCSSLKNKSRQHDSKCSWYKDHFLKSIGVESYGTVHDYWKDKGYEQPSDYMCCCKPEKSHYELEKYKLMTLPGKEENKDIVVFPKLESGMNSGTVDFGDSKFLHKLTYPETNLFGHRKFINEVLNNFSDLKKVIYLHGPSKSGKTQICLFLLNYLEQHRKDVIPFYRDMADEYCSNDRPETWKVFLKISETMCSTDKKYYIVLDNIDRIKERRWKPFHQHLFSLMPKSNLFFIVTFTADDDIKETFATLLFNKEINHKVPKIETELVADYILNRIKDNQMGLKSSFRHAAALKKDLLTDKQYCLGDILKMINIMESAKRLIEPKDVRIEFDNQSNKLAGAQEIDPSEFKRLLKITLR